MRVYKVKAPKDFSYDFIDHVDAEQKAIELARMYPGEPVEIRVSAPYATVTVPAEPDPIFQYAKDTDQ